MNARVLLVDASASDLELARMVIARELPLATIAGAHDATTLATALAGDPPTVAVLATGLGWTDTHALRAMLRERRPLPAIVLFGTTDELVSHCLEPGIAAAGIVSKSSAGYLALGGIVREVVAARETAATRTAPPPGVALDEWPLPGCLLDADGRVRATNAAFATLAGPAASTNTVADWLADDAAHKRWQALCDGVAAAADVAADFGAGNSRRLHLSRAADGYVGMLTAAPTAGINVVQTGARDAASREMQDIAMVFSHNLKEPLHQITRLAQRLGERGDAQRGADAERLTDQLQTCAERAAAMLNGVLEYLTVSSHEEQSGLVDLDNCLDQALDNLHVVLDESGANVVAEPLPSVPGDAYQLVHLLQNLIANAVKFHGRGRPEIRLAARPDGANWVICIDDNGIGIAEAHRERVFEMGQRLHTRDEYPGAGIGLTLCRRIVERHGGTISIESGDRGGTRVVIVLPRTPEHVTRLA